MNKYEMEINLIIFNKSSVYLKKWDREKKHNTFVLEGSGINRFQHTEQRMASLKSFIEDAIKLTTRLAFQDT